MQDQNPIVQQTQDASQGAPMENEPPVTPTGNRDGVPEAPVKKDPAPSWSHPAERYKDWKVISKEEMYHKNITDAAKTSLDASETEQEKKSGPEDYGVFDWLGDMGQATIFGPLVEPVAALYLSAKHDVSYKRAMQAIEKGQEGKEESLSAQIVGGIIGGGLVGKGMLWAGTRSGITEAGMRWTAKNPKIRKYVAGAAVGGSAGIIEEGIRTTMEETVDASAGYGFEGDRIVDNVLVGGFLGTAAGPAMQAGMGGAKWVAQFTKRVFGNSDQQTMDATRMLIRTFADEGEDLDAAAERFRFEVADYKQKYGKVPAAADIMRPEQIEELSEVIRMHNGLDKRARDLGEEGVRRALKNYDEAIMKNPDIVLSPERIRVRMEDLYTDVMKRKGSLKTYIDDDTMMVLEQNQGFIDELAASGNPGAKKIREVLELKKNDAKMQKDFAAAENAKIDAEAFDHVQGFRKQLGEFAMDQMEKAERKAARKDGSAAAVGEGRRLQTLIKYHDALAKKVITGRNSTAASFRYDQIKEEFEAAQTALNEYMQDGIQITLSDANTIRKAASKQFSDYNRSGKSAKADRARFIRDHVSKIGTNVDEEYAGLAKRFNLENTRAEAQMLGEKAVKGQMDLDELDVRLERGRVPRKPAAGSPEGVDAVREGAREGAIRELKGEAGTLTEKGDPFMNPAAKSAGRVANNQKVREGLRKTVGEPKAKEITDAADQAVKSYQNNRILATAASKSQLREEAEFASEVLGGAVWNGLGGAAKVGILNRFLTRMKVPRGTAKKLVEMMGNPDEIDKALSFAQKKGIRVGPMFSAILNSINEPTENEVGL